MKHSGWLFGLWWLALGCGARQQDAQLSAAKAPSVPPVAVIAQPAAPIDELQSDAGAVLAAMPPSIEQLLATLPPASSSTSIGSPTNGKLAGGVALPLVGPGFHHNDRRSREARFGTLEVVRAIASAADVVARAVPGGELVVNDLGLPAGGTISHHGSHRAGRDADILFYLLDDSGQPMPSVGAPLDPDGIGFDYKELADPSDDQRVHFDAARTWRFVQALLEAPDSQVQRIFVVEHLRTKLLAQASEGGAPAALIARFADLSCQPGYPHDDHLHVRWFCSVEDLGLGCEDAVPLYPWRAAELKEAGVQPVLAKRTRSEEPAAVVTQADAEKAVLAATPHADVLAFLKRRKAWEKQPHPGRPYCR